MILGGDAIDDMLGATFKISTLACAACANTFADVLGISIGSTVEGFTGQLGLPQANLTLAQLELRSVRNAGRLGASGGIFIGCIMGMFPLYFKSDDKESESETTSS